MNALTKPTRTYDDTVKFAIDRAISENRVSRTSTFASILETCFIDGAFPDAKIRESLERNGGFLAEDVSHNSAVLFGGYTWVLQRYGAWTVLDEEGDLVISLPPHPPEARAAILSAYIAGEMKGEAVGAWLKQNEIRKALGL